MFLIGRNASSVAVILDSVCLVADMVTVIVLWVARVPAFYQCPRVFKDEKCDPVFGKCLFDGSSSTIHVHDLCGPMFSSYYIHYDGNGFTCGMMWDEYG